MTVNILSTAELDALLVSNANQEVQLDVIPFIRVRHILDEQPELQAKVAGLCRMTANVVFTSANAVRAIESVITDADGEWTIYCIGNATKNEVSRVFKHAAIKGSANDASHLAEIIIKDGDVAEVIFFCGDKRMETLPRILQSKNISVHEYVVYETEETPVAVKNEYNGILFFSPSAVHSFFSVNKPGKDAILFAIGNTTAEAIADYTSNKVIVSNQNHPSKEKVVTDAIQYFKNETIAK